MMPVFIAVALLLWLVLGGIVAILVCPLIKDPADRWTEPRDTADAFSGPHPVAHTLLPIKEELH